MTKRRYLDSPNNPPTLTNRRYTTYYAIPQYGFTPQTSQTNTYTPTTTDVQKDIAARKPIGTTTAKRVIKAKQQEQQATIQEPTFNREIQDNINKANQTQRVLTPVQRGLDVAEYLPIVGDAISFGRAGAEAVNGNLLGAGTAAAMFLLPNAIGKPVNKIRKSIKRLTKDVPMYWPIQTEADKYAANVAAKAYPPEMITYVNDEAIKKGYNRYKKAVEEASLDTDYRLMDFWSPKSKRQLNDVDYSTLEDIAMLSPEYIKFLSENSKLNPLSQETVDKFFDRQSRSVRGVYVSKDANKTQPVDIIINKRGKATPLNTKAKSLDEIAEEYLTKPPKSGADRLETHGLYTSNGRYVADKFMRSETGTGATSYIGTVKYPFNIDRQKPIKEQLRDYRKYITNYDYDVENPLAKMTEAEYVRGTGDRAKHIYERSIHPNGDDSVVTLIDLQNAGIDLPNLHGRWGFNTVTDNADNDLFIPKMPSRDAREFIDYYRRLKAAHTMNIKKVSPEYKSTEANAKKLYYSQNTKRNKLIDKLAKRQKLALTTAGIAGGTAISVPAFIGLNNVLNNNNKNDDRLSLKSGGRIYIKPENRGKFTALKDRTGHSATWFKENGTPAQKKMAVFALNSRKWKH